MNKKDFILFVSIFCLLALVVGGTYAYWQWESAENTMVVFNTSVDIEDDIYYDGGNSRFVGNFQPSINHCGGKGNTLSFYIKSNAREQVKEKDSNGKGILFATLKMDINAIASNISSSSYVKWAVTQGSEADCATQPLASGSFNGKTAGNTMTLLSNLEILDAATCGGNTTKAPTNSDCKYTVWVWVDSAGGVALNDLSGQTIDVNVWTQIEMRSAD